MMKQPRVIADLVLLLIAAVWGGTFVMVREAVSQMPVFNFLALRFGVAFIALVFISKPRQIFSLDRKSIWLCIVAGAAFTAGYGFQTIGLQTTGPGQVGFITGLAVILVPIGSALIWRARPTRSSVIGIVCALIGLALLTGAINGEPIAPGAVWVLLGTLGFAAQILAIGALPKQIDPRTTATVQVLSTALGCGLISFLTETPIIAAGPQVWGTILFTGIVVSALGIVAQTWAQAITSATHTALIFSMEPVFAAVAGFILIDERLSAAQMIGCGLILSGMLIGELWPNRSSAQSE